MRKNKRMEATTGKSTPIFFLTATRRERDRRPNQLSSRASTEHCLSLCLSLCGKALALWFLSIFLCSVWFLPGGASSLQSHPRRGLCRSLFPESRKFLKPSSQILLFPSCFSLLKIPCARALIYIYIYIYVCMRIVVVFSSEL